ncbi:MAG: DoxX family protein [Gammaproteobacteria bacterium]|nr:DoxX family protein [Gammaproteobacteria bacterium]
METMIKLKNQVINTLDSTGEWFALLPIRLLMAYEFGRAGMMKLNGTNWFANVQDNFPFPFNVVPVEISWFIATWAELLGAAGLVLGLFTRFWALSLIILTVVAISGVHWPDHWNSLAELWKGYSVSNKGFGNFRIPLLFLVMLIPLLFSGAGKFSLDHMLAKKFS